eukprot:gnl/MRDRNA2_/MRDRNA2_72729_c0_seq2.p2 gnl/MRDRNA2_/MRDRNA2_72729_c0~~gnl/MRDRNA2_/MRDRNA2_72729_c0_seq2.p2  ORF type:complete len:100 (-),score=22.35 gnl/MRDRNA2_/MRDRNA2_72729_c0_seq2:133-432(-)
MLDGRRQEFVLLANKVGGLTNLDKKKEYSQKCGKSNPDDMTDEEIVWCMGACDAVAAWLEIGENPEVEQLLVKHFGEKDDSESWCEMSQKAFCVSNRKS